MENGKKLEFPEGQEGVRGSGIRFADSDDQGFPLIITYSLLFIF
jgi:hypothetical protein